MGTKVCNICKEEKPLEEFYKRKSASDGHYGDCKCCHKRKSRDNYYSNREHKLALMKEYREANKGKLAEYMREYGPAYRADNKDKIAERAREYYQANKSVILDKTREYRQANAARLVDYRKKYREANKKRIAEYNLQYANERRASDPMFALKDRCRRRIRSALTGQGFSKRASTKDILGCTYDELMQHMESQFTEGMSWDNRSEWHVDHIIPLASAQTEDEILALCHYTNLQPLWAGENLLKGATVPKEALYA